MLDTPNMFIESIGNNFLLYDANFNKKSDYYISCFADGAIKSQALYKKCSDQIFLTSNVFCKTDNDNVFIQHAFSDTVYVADINLNIKQYCCIDFNGKGANENLLGKQKFKDYHEKSKENNYVTDMMNFACLDNFLFFRINDNNGVGFVLYDTKTKETSIHTQLYDGLPNSYVIAGKTNKFAVFSVSVSWLIDFFEKNGVKDDENVIKLKSECTEENDNPILIFFSSPN